LPQTTASGSLSLRIPGLPASLTIERIQTAVCVMCRKPGEWVGFSWLSCCIMLFVVPVHTIWPHHTKYLSQAVTWNDSTVKIAADM
jgi:hypothetical protein